MTAALETAVKAKTYHTDARAFGQFIKHGGDWKYAAKVARWVEPSKGGRPSANLEDVTGIQKISAEQFSKTAGVSRPTVMKYLKAWDYCAEHHGFVLSSKSIDAGEEIELPEDLTPDLWVECYREANTKKVEEIAEPEAEEAGGAVEEELSELEQVEELAKGLEKVTRKAQDFNPSTGDATAVQIAAIESAIAALMQKLELLKSSQEG